MHMLIGKRQIILSALVLALGIAIYLNWQFANGSDPLALTGKTTETGKNYGDAQFVSGSVSGQDTESAKYFAETRMEKQKSRDDAVDSLKSMMDKGGLDEEAQQTIATQITQITSNTTAENKMETLIKAKGFEDCVVYIEDQTVSVMVKTPGLVASEAAQIKDIVLGNTEVDNENIRIVEVK